MKTKKTVTLPAIVLISFLFSGCTTIYSFLYGSTRWYEYDFSNKKNKNVTKDRYGRALDVMGDTRLRFSFNFSTNGYLYKNRKDIRGGRYGLGITLSSENNLIRKVSFNKVMIYAGEGEYSMVEKFISILLATPRGDIILTEENLADIRSSGFIDFSAYTLGDENYTTLWDTSINLFYRDAIHINFQYIPIDVIRYKEIKVCFDISVEYTTGEIIILSEEVIGLRKVDYVPNLDYLWVPGF